MARITIIDDDMAMEILEDNLRYLGNEVVRLSSATEALTGMASVVQSDLVVLDIIMERPEGLPGTVFSGGRTTGMEIYRQIRQARPNLPIVVYSATSDLNIIELLNRDPHATFFPKWNTPRLTEVVHSIEAMLGVEHKTAPPQAFIVHGHDEATKWAVKNYLQNTLKLPEPIILHEQPSLGRTIIEKFERYASQSNLVFVILTPDDRVAESTEKDNEKRRARQNVIFELGFFLGALDRSSGRVFLLYKGPLELPSDIEGIVYIDISNGIDAAGEQMRKELAHVLQQ